MNIKPFSEIVTDEKETQQAPPLKPFIDNAVGGIEIDEIEVTKKEFHNEKNLLKKLINFLASAQGFFSVLILFILIAVAVDTIQTIQALYNSNSLLDVIYLFALTALGITLSTTTYKNYQQIRALKSAKKIQEFYALQKDTPDKEIIPVTLKLLAIFSLNKDELLQQKIQLLESRISTSHDYKEIYKDLDEDILNIIDIKAKEKIKVASTQAAISTAIAPSAILDGVIIIWRSVLLTKEISLLYGFKPGWLSTLILLKHGAFNVFFAGTAELASEYINDMTESSLISKISTSATQGLTNGILLARLGFGVMQACRPLPITTRRGSFMKGIYLSIKDLIFDSKEK